MNQAKPPRRKQSDWQKIIASQQQSGLNAREYCARHGIKLTSFRAWKSKIKSAQPAFAKVKVQPQSRKGQIRCLLSNGIELAWDEGVSAHNLVSIIRALS